MSNGRFGIFSTPKQASSLADFDVLDLTGRMLHAGFHGDFLQASAPSLSDNQALDLALQEIANYRSAARRTMGS